jgi:hypothetical protein
MMAVAVVSAQALCIMRYKVTTTVQAGKNCYKGLQKVLQIPKKEDQT